MRRFAVTYEYTEFVHGELRRFVHESILEAENQDKAYDRALLHFRSLALQSQVGWTRTLHRCAVAPARAEHAGRHAANHEAER